MQVAKSSRVAAFIMFRDSDLVMRVPNSSAVAVLRDHTHEDKRRGGRAGGYFRSDVPAPAGIGFWLIMRCAYGVSP